MGALKSAKCSRGHLMRDPNLYYTKSGQRQCLRCKLVQGKAYRERNKERLKAARKKKEIARRIAEGIPTRREKSLRTKIKRKESTNPEARGTTIEGHDV